MKFFGDLELIIHYFPTGYCLSIKKLYILKARLKLKSLMMLTQKRKILFSVVASIGIGFSILVGASLALTYQPSNMMTQQFSMNSNFPPNIGFSGSQFNTMMPNSGQGSGGMNQGMMMPGMQSSMMGKGMMGSGMNQDMRGAGSGMNPMMQMMSMMMSGMSSSAMNNMQSTSMSSIIPLSGPTNTSGLNSQKIGTKSSSGSNSRAKRQVDFNCR